MTIVTKEIKERVSIIYDIPKEQNIALSVLESEGFMKSQTAKKLINSGKLKAVTVGRKFYIPRMELIRYLADELGFLNQDEVATK
jgi:hypothetical protein